MRVIIKVEVGFCEGGRVGGFMDEYGVFVVVFVL